jgi:[protein-PII] uridylyltransferase
VTDPVAILRSELGALDRAYSPGHHGRWVARRRAGLIDACLVALWDLAAAPAGAALVAIGGYGRRVQLPMSDVDLLILHDRVDAGELARLADAILYPLWNSGLAIGHVVRTPAECLDAAERFDAWTAMLDARTVAGDTAAVDVALEPVRARARRDPGAFLALVRDAAAARAARFGSCAHLLEPDLKEGTGGLRDAASLGWLTAATGAELEDAGVLRARERGAVEDAEEFLVRARSAVQLLTGRRTDRLVAELQPDVARAMGFGDEPGLVAADGLMRALFEHARDMELVVDLVPRRLEAPPVEHATTASIEDPASVLASLADLADADLPPTAALLDAIEAAELGDPAVWDDDVRSAFLRTLRAGEAGARMLEVLDRLRLLTSFIPAWAAVRCRPQRDPYHRFTVDVHLLRAAASVAAMLDGRGDVRNDVADADDPIERAALEQVEQRDAVLLGALLHDIGKTGAGGHVPIGTAIAAETLDAMGFAPELREQASFLVAEHLLLSDTATRRDLSDENLLLDTAARIGTPERLAALYLVTKADAVATGPAAWTPWRRALIRELVAKLQRVFERGDMGRELAERLADRTERLRALLAAEPEAEVDRFVLRMPRGYFLTTEPAQAARHFRTIAPPVGTNEVRTAASPGARPDTYEVLVVATDRPGLLSWIAGSLAIGGISVLSAAVFTTGDGTAIDLFEVEGAFEPEITETRWREFRTTLRRTIEGSVSLERRVEDKRRHYPPPKVRSPLTVRSHNDVSEFSTVVEIGAPDRIGLLYDITRTFADLRLDVHLAKVATYGGRVIDAFYVRDALGRKIVEPAALAEVDQALRERLDA